MVCDEFATTEFGDRAGFHFDEGEHGAVVADHINLALYSESGEITRDKSVAVAPQVPICVSFARDAGLPRALLGGKFACRMARRKRARSSAPCARQNQRWKTLIART